MRIAADEQITSERTLLLLKVAALYHDTGFIYQGRKHEKKSCEIFLNDDRSNGFDKEERSLICSLIMATQTPQKPTNLLERIICDADLDYLGRNDFFSLSELLHKEFLEVHVVNDDAEWEMLQYNFLKNHHYFTNSSRTKREPVKLKHLEKIKVKLNGHLRVH